VARSMCCLAGEPRSFGAALKNWRCYSNEKLQ
jgi:hypothetical protein